MQGGSQIILTLKAGFFTQFNIPEAFKTLGTDVYLGSSHKDFPHHRLFLRLPPRRVSPTHPGRLLGPHTGIKLGMRGTLFRPPLNKGGQNVIPGRQISQIYRGKTRSHLGSHTSPGAHFTCGVSPLGAPVRRGHILRGPPRVAAPPS